MANDRETKSYQVKPERPQDTSAALRANGGGETMAGGKGADLRPHGEAGSSGVGLPPQPDDDMSISARDSADASPGSGDGSRATGSSMGTEPGQTTGASDDR